MSDTTPSAAVFARVTGQAMNVGDSVLRRPYIRALRSLGAMHLLVRQMPQAYLDGLDVREDDTLYTSDDDWRAAVRRSASSQPTWYAFNAGEMQFSRFYTQDLLEAFPLLRAARRSGGSALMLGVSIRSPRSRWAPVMRTLLRAVPHLSWRDAQSRAWTRRGTVQPDWAFAEGSATIVTAAATPRPRLAVTVRGDLAFPSDDWFAAVRRIAQQNALEPVVVSQVEVDTEPMAEVARRLNAEFVGMTPGISHATQEAVVRKVYAQSRAVVSDRLHALVMGATEGAVPLGIADGGAVKAQRHFSVVGLDSVARSVGAVAAAGVELTETARQAVVSAVDEARGRLLDLEASFSDRRAAEATEVRSW